MLTWLGNGLAGYEILEEKRIIPERQFNNFPLPNLPFH